MQYILYTVRKIIYFANTLYIQRPGLSLIRSGWPGSLAAVADLPRVGVYGPRLPWLTKSPKYSPAQKAPIVNIYTYIGYGIYTQINRLWIYG